jgi:hypothetical protein
MISPDTSLKASALQLRMLQGLSGAQRLKMAIEMSDFVRRLKFSALRSEHPELSEADLQKIVLKSCFTSTEILPRPLR